MIEVLNHLITKILYKQSKFQIPCSFCPCLVFVPLQQTKHRQKEHGVIHRLLVLVERKGLAAIA